MVEVTRLAPRQPLQQHTATATTEKGDQSDQDLGRDRGLFRVLLDSVRSCCFVLCENSATACQEGAKY